MTDQLTPQIRAMIAQKVNEVFADPNATSAQVLEAIINHLAINNIFFYTASGEVALHLQAGVEALKELDRHKGKRRYLGMPRDSDGPDGEQPT